MKTNDSELEALAARISDGSEIDWKAADGSIAEEERRVVKNLRVVSEIASFHRSSWLAPAPEGTGTPPDPKTPLAGGIPPEGAGRVLPLTPIGRWGPLELLEKIGQGSFGEVYRARDPRLEREVALKLVRRDRTSRIAIERSVLREGRHLAKLRHPNLVTVFGAERHDDRVGLWMELLRGHTLEEIARRQGTFGASEAAVIGIELCQALAAIHRAGLVHRDVKAQNVLREAGGRVVLMDLGLAETDDDASWEDGSSLAGTPLYMAPELLSGKQASAGSDLYALGVLLFQLVSGEFPIRAKRLRDLKEAHARGERRSLRDLRADLPAAFVEVIERALAADPARRFTSAGEMERALAGAVGMSRPSTASGSAASRIEDRVANGSIHRRTRRRWLGIAAIFGLAILGGSGLWYQRAHAPYRIQATLYRVHGGGEKEKLVPGSDVEVGDFLGFELKASRSLFVYVMSEDDQGESYLLFPLPGFEQKNPLPGAATHALPGRVAGRELYWRVSSAGGRERFLVMASPSRLEDLEREIQALPTPREDQEPEIAARLSSETTARMRGIGHLGSADPARDGRMSGIVSRVRRLAESEEHASGVWVREIELRNPAR